MTAGEAPTSTFSTRPLPFARFNFAARSILLPSVDLEPYRAFMIELAAASGDLIRPYFADPGLAVELKADQTPVTLADRGAEELMRAMIAKRFPRHGLIGEEFGNENPDAEFAWVLDPIDGTKAFAAACPLFGTLIALMHLGQPVLGVIHQPILRQLVIGDGRATTLNGRAVRLRPCARVEDCTLLTGDPFNPGKYRDGPAFDALARRAKLVRTWGDCYGYLLVATGWADVMCDPIVNPWDIQAIIPIIRGAGGVITDWQGKDPVRGDSLVAAGQSLHPQIIAGLNGY
jgi:histidinol phosphatase-like enzyme (inositol monophosphatase family)